MLMSIFGKVSKMCIRDRPYSESRMLELLQSPYADIQNFALHNLYRNDYPGISDLLRKTFETSSFMMVRFTCLALLEKISDKNFREVLHLAITDSYEFIRRTSCLLYTSRCV